MNKIAPASQKSPRPSCRPPYVAIACHLPSSPFSQVLVSRLLSTSTRRTTVCSMNTKATDQKNNQEAPGKSIPVACSARANDTKVLEMFASTSTR
jgi:hypothetical protein